MDSLYVPQIVKVKVNLDASEIDANFEEKLKRKIKDKYGDSCYYNGFIRKSSIELTKIEPGRRLGSHLHGAMTFKVEFRAHFCVPKKDKLIRCRIKTVNKFGALAEFYPMEIIIPKQIHHDNIDVFSTLSEGKHVYVRCLNYDIKEDKLIVVGIITGLAIDKQTYLVLPSDAYIGDYKAQIITSHSPPQPNKLLGNADILNDMKGKIKEHSYTTINGETKPGIWETLIKFLINPYELIETYSEDKPGKFAKYDKSVIKYDKKGINGVYPIFSRAYFKLWEILKEKDLNIMEEWKGKPIRIASLAEGPGGFIQAMIDFRNKQNDGQWKKDTYAAITLKSGSKGDGTLDWSYPKSKAYSDMLKTNGYTINLSYGETGNGDLTKLDNIRHFATKDLSGEKCELVTADGGIELVTEEEYGLQEIMNAKLFFSEILAALTVQKLEGTFVIKIYDILNDITKELITLLSGYYEQITIIKPRTSRPANSEKYVVCQKFKGISDEKLTELYNLHTLWLEAESAPKYLDNTKFVKTLFQFFGTNDSAYLKNLIEFNDTTITMTIEKITEGLYLIANGDIKKKDVLDTYKANQRELAIEWCKEFDMDYVTSPST